MALWGGAAYGQAAPTPATDKATYFANSDLQNVWKDLEARQVLNKRVLEGGAYSINIRIVKPTDAPLVHAKSLDIWLVYVAKEADFQKGMRLKQRINLAKPYEDLSKKAQDALFEGVAGLPGVMAVLDDTYQNSSEGYREWLTEYMSPSECPACHGKRLRPASLAVRVKNFAIDEFTGLPLARALMTVRNWELNDREQQIAGRVLDEMLGAGF